MVTYEGREDGKWGKKLSEDKQHKSGTSTDRRVGLPQTGGELDLLFLRFNGNNNRGFCSSPLDMLGFQEIVFNKHCH